MAAPASTRSADCIVREELSRSLPGVRVELVGAQPSRHLADLAGRHRQQQKRALLPPGARRREDRRLRPERARRRLEHPRAEDPGRQGRRRLAAQRQQALHHQRADRRFPAGRRAHPRRSSRLTRSACSSSSCRTPASRISKLKKEGIRASETGADPHRRRVRARRLPARRRGGHLSGDPGVAHREPRRGRGQLRWAWRARAFEAVARVRARRASSRGKRIGDYQAIAHKLADMAADIEAAQWLVYYGAWRVDQGTLDAATAAKVKLVASETAVRVERAGDPHPRRRRASCASTRSAASTATRWST